MCKHPHIQTLHPHGDKYTCYRITNDYYGQRVIDHVNAADTYQNHAGQKSAVWHGSKKKLIERIEEVT